MIDGRVDLGGVSAGSSSIGLYYATVLYEYVLVLLDNSNRTPGCVRVP